MFSIVDKVIQLSRAALTLRRLQKVYFESGVKFRTNKFVSVKFGKRVVDFRGARRPDAAAMQNVEHPPRARLAGASPETTISSRQAKLRRAASNKKRLGQISSISVIASVKA